jgi:predicted DNA-binding ribbon-helix-helix protein
VEEAMKSAVVKRSLSIGGHKTSISLEEAFWNALKEVARVRGTTLSDLVAAIDRDRPGNLSSAVRVFTFNHFRGQSYPVSRDQYQDSSRTDAIPYSGAAPD